MCFCTSSYFDLYGRPAMILSAITSPTPGSFISSCFEAVFRSISSLDVAAAALWVALAAGLAIAFVAPVFAVLEGVTAALFAAVVAGLANAVPAHAKVTSAMIVMKRF